MHPNPSTRMLTSHPDCDVSDAIAVGRFHFEAVDVLRHEAPRTRVLAVQAPLAHDLDPAIAEVDLRALGETWMAGPAKALRVGFEKRVCEIDVRLAAVLNLHELSARHPIGA